MESDKYKMIGDYNETILYCISNYYMAEYILGNEIIHTLTVLITTLYIVNRRKRIKMKELNEIINAIQFCLSLNQATKYRKIQGCRIRPCKI